MKINELAQYHGVGGERICKLDTEGNIVWHGFLIYLFLSFVDVSFMAHMHERMDELLKNGITISDQCICQLAKERIPQEIITKLYGETAGS